MCICGIILKAPRGPSPSLLAFSILYGQEKAMSKSRPGHFLLFYHCVLIVYECIYKWYGTIKIMHFICYAETDGFPKSDHILSYYSHWFKYVREQSNVAG